MTPWHLLFPDPGPQARAVIEYAREREHKLTVQRNEAIQYACGSPRRVTIDRQLLIQQPRSVREHVDWAIVVAASLVLLISVLAVALFILSVARSSGYGAGSVVTDARGIRWPVPSHLGASSTEPPNAR